MTSDPKLISPRKRKRVHVMMWAYLTFAQKKTPIKARDILCWALLLEWASLGGTKDEVIR